jgi:TRAP-type uncharacterized transport system fused permease subunit
MISLIVIRSMAVVLAGMYAMRTGYAPMEGRVEPLTFLPLLILVLCVVIFHRPPTEAGLWSTIVLALCAIGFGVNLVFMRLAPKGAVDYYISILSAGAWAVIGVAVCAVLVGARRLA